MAISLNRPNLPLVDRYFLLPDYTKSPRRTNFKHNPFLHNAGGIEPGAFPKSDTAAKITCRNRGAPLKNMSRKTVSRISFR